MSREVADPRHSLSGQKTDLVWEKGQLPEEDFEDAGVLGRVDQDSAMGGRGRRESSWSVLSSFLSE